jgi:thiol-disulfide isomerase/thioredoxin
MKRLFLLLALEGILLQGAALTPVDESGYTKLLSSHKGKVVLVNFWATYCVPCRKEMPDFVRLHERLKARGLVFVTISADEPEDEARAKAFLEKMNIPQPHYIRKARSDDAFINFVDPKWSGALPATFVHDRAGRKVRAFFGEADLKALEAAILKSL